MCSIDVHSLVEKAITAHTVSAEAGHSVGKLEGRPAVDTRSFHPRGLTGRIIGHLVLEEDVRAAITLPDHFVLLVVLDSRPYAVTFSPLTMTPVLAVFEVQPTPLPWSARHAQMLSRITLSLLTTRLVVALPASAPPIRKKTS